MRKHTITGSFIREIIFGLNDGLVSTLALISGLAGAVLSNRIIILGGLAEMFAGAISMALGAYISSKSQIEYYQQEIKNSKKHKHRLLILDEKIDLDKTKFKDPKKIALFIGLAFIIGALIPIIPYFFISDLSALIISVMISVIALFLVGASKTHFTYKNWFKSGIEMVMIGILAAGVAYLIGLFFSSII